ncbi:hypothetical protein V502_08962 [Pseudogymnoascus sp. VKM F-4520 (FW-2644)]|nr:hypothetical protein V502_08962 [Pseudogymnoascus sp. VKM F-4520 (FW-2644)]
MAIHQGDSSIFHSLLWTAIYLGQAWWYIIVPLLVCIRYLIQRYASSLRRYPGPTLASYSRLWKVLSVASGHTELDHIALHRKYGPIVRIAPNELSFSSPKIARDILAAGKGFSKTDFYSVFPPPDNPDIFTETREPVHAQKKRIAAPPYSMNAMLHQSPYIEDLVNLMVSKLDVYANQPEHVCNLGDWLHFLPFDVIGEVAFGHKYGFLDSGTDWCNVIQFIDDVQWYNGIVGQVPFLHPFLLNNPIFKALYKMKYGVPLTMQMALDEIQRRKPFKTKVFQQDERKDLLESLIQAHVATPDRFSEGDVFAVCHGAIGAGADSTASTMQSFFFLLLKHKPIYTKLLSEIDAAYDSGKLSYPHVKWNEAQINIPYFQACLKESMRLRPAVGLNISRQVPAAGAEIDGKWFPGGTRLAVNGWVLHRDKEMFGQDADLYRPERWLEDPEKARIMERHMFQNTTFA